MSEGARIGSREWCPDCYTYREVVDDHLESVPRSGYMRRSTTEEEYWVLDLNCGHSKSRLRGAVTYRDHT